MRELANKLLPRHLIKTLRNTGLRVLDIFDQATGNSDWLIPPRALHYVGGGDFRAIGKEFFGYFREICYLEPQEKVLDIGCGTGRMAVPLLDYLSEYGTYIGFDISKEAIAWCNKRISEADLRFTFHHADIYNKEYNPTGCVQALDYKFPCEDSSIDFAFATSVFTHMFPKDVQHYLVEIYRVLRPGGRCLVTYFVLDNVSRANIAQNRSVIQFDVELDGCYTIDPKTPERAIAYTEDWVRQAHRQIGLQIDGSIRSGSWSGRNNFLTFQDVVIATKSQL